MKKIITLFQRNDTSDRRVRDEVTPEAEWVLAGEGVATRKWDGTACLVRNGKLYKRYDAKKGKTPPAAFEPAQPDPDPVTGHWPGWLPVGTGPEDQYHREAWERASEALRRDDWTYELVGPKIQGGAERGFVTHQLVRHGACYLTECPREFDAIQEFLAAQEIEGIVWWREPGFAGSMQAKIKRKDFGLPWPVKEAP